MVPQLPIPSAAGDRFSVCEHVVRLGDIAQDVAAAVEAGARGFSVNASDLGSFSVAEAADVLTDAGLAVTSFIDPSVMRLGPAAPDLDAVARAADAAAELGAPAILFISGALGGRRVADADAQLVDSLGAIAARIAPSGVHAMLEPLHPIARDLSYVHTMRHAVALVEQVPSARLVIDTGASWWEPTLVDEVVAHLDLVVAVQITGVRGADLAKRTYVREACSTDGEVPVGDIARDLVAAGYSGWFEHEVLAPFDRDERVEVLRADRQWFAGLWS
ncbi:MAG: sugar phosphate isomerase/epimerase family protein [Ilumatobacteraceae bacterium]